MSAKVSTRVEETTKEQFEKICEAIGITPASALSMFISSVVNYKGIPFNVMVPSRGAAVRSPDNLDFKAYRAKIGGWEDKISVSSDFNKPIVEVKE